MTETAEMLPPERFTITCKECHEPFQWDRPAVRADNAFVKTFPTPTICYACARQAPPATATGPQWEDYCPDIYRGTEIARLPYPDKARQALAWFAETDAPKGLLLHGPTGAGKTRTAFLVLRKFFDAGKHLQVFMAGEFGQTVARVFGDRKGDQWVRNMTACGVLFIDDLGKSKLTERAATAMFSIIEHRMAAGKAMILTTQYRGGSMALRFDPDAGAALVRRLREGYTSISMGRTEEKP